MSKPMMRVISEHGEVVFEQTFDSEYEACEVMNDVNVKNSVVQVILENQEVYAENFTNNSATI